MSLIRQKAIEGLNAGDTFSVSRTFTEGDVTKFADISKDYNPVHFDDSFARSKNLDGRICHGLLVAALLTEIGGEIGWLASGMEFNFRKPVYFGDTITCHFTIVAIDGKGRAKAEARFTNGHGTIVTEAILSGVLPSQSERRIMQTRLRHGLR